MDRPQIDRLTLFLTGRQADGQRRSPTDGQTDAGRTYTGRLTDTWTDGQADEHTSRLMDRQTDPWTDRQTDGRMNELTEGWTPPVYRL